MCLTVFGPRLRAYAAACTSCAQEYGVPPLPVFAYPTAAQLQKLLSESYDCSSTPTVDQLEQAAAKLAEQVWRVLPYQLS